MTTEPWSSLIAAREAVGWSRFRLAAEMRINLSHLGRLERGDAAPRADTVRRAAEALGVTVQQVAPEGHSVPVNTPITNVAQLEALIREVVREELRKGGGS